MFLTYYVTTEAKLIGIGFLEIVKETIESYFPNSKTFSLIRLILETL